jgi:hypothetical protein
MTTIHLGSSKVITNLVSSSDLQNKLEPSHNNLWRDRIAVEYEIENVMTHTDFTHYTKGTLLGGHTVQKRRFP